jgi:hypothetical protein
MFELVTADFGAVVVEDHATGAGRALVDRRDELCHSCSLLTAAVVHHGLRGFTDSGH